MRHAKRVLNIRHYVVIQTLDTESFPIGIDVCVTCVLVPGVLLCNNLQLRVGAVVSVRSLAASCGSTLGNISEFTPHGSLYTGCIF